MADKSPGKGPAATGKASPSGKTVLTKQAGPLPVWGWGAVGVGSVFLFRMIYAKKQATSSPTQAAVNTTGSAQNPVIVMPNSQAPAYTQLPGLSVAQSSNLTPSEQEVIYAYNKYLNRNPDPQGYQYWTQRLDSGSINAADFEKMVQNSDEAKKMSTSMSTTSNTAGVAGFFNQNNAARLAGLPYVYSQNGTPVVYNPTTNTSAPLPTAA